MSLVHRLLYRSDVALPGSPDEVEAAVAAIVGAARSRNEAAGLTGALMTASGVFVQVLEGPLAPLEATFARICGDLRHRRVRLLDFAVAEERAFGDWSMAAVSPTQGLEDLCPELEFAEEPRLDAVTAQSAMRLMRALLPAGPDLGRSGPLAG